MVFLLNINPDINISINDDEAFKNACYNGHLDIVIFLLKLKPSIDISKLEVKFITNKKIYDFIYQTCIDKLSKIIKTIE